MNRVLIVAAALSAFAAPAAYAADFAPTPAPATAQAFAPQSAYDWSGFYAGVNAAYSWGELDIGPVGVPPASTFDLDGALGGVQVGYNQDFGGFVLGVEGDVQLGNVIFSQTIGVATSTVTMQYFGTVRARAGMAIDRFMPYVTGGVALGHGEMEFAALGTTASDTQDHIGWTAGAGLEYAVTNSISVKGEYLYTDLGTKTYTVGGLPADAAMRFGTVRAGVNFQF